MIRDDNNLLPIYWSWQLRSHHMSDLRHLDISLLRIEEDETCPECSEAEDTYFSTIPGKGKN